MLVPSYSPVVKTMKPTQKSITLLCVNTALSVLTGRSGGVCILCHISKCVVDVTNTRTITIHPNQKPWLTAEVRSLLRARDSTFRISDTEVLRAARRNLTKGIKRAKADYALKIQGHFSTNDPQSMWASIKSITDYNRRDTECPRDPSLPDANPNPTLFMLALRTDVQAESRDINIRMLKSRPLNGTMNIRRDCFPKLISNASI